VLSVLSGTAHAPLSDFELPAAIVGNLFWIVAALAFCFPLRGALERLAAPRLPAPATGAMTLSMNLLQLGLATTLLVGSSYNPFIYFRF
jgi:alginate O-acetyltransferase complex protein AlgI